MWLRTSFGVGADRIEDPNGEGPRIWFQVVPEKKSSKNRIHIDVNASGGRGSPFETRRERVEAEAARLVSLGATRLHTIAAGALIAGVLADAWASGPRSGSSRD
ncbi:MAG: VOC family protein [Pseudonocardiales bacterium]